MKNFADRLTREIRMKDSAAVVGLDPRIALMPDVVMKASLRGGTPTARRMATAFTRFGKGVIDSVHNHCVAIKIQIAFYELLGPHGLTSFLETQEHAKRRGLLVIGDIKRGDIGSTAEAYATAYLGKAYFKNKPLFSHSLDAVTINPYFGTDGVGPFLGEAKKHGKGIFFLIKTSNPSSRELQNFPTRDAPLYAKVARLVNSWGKDLVGAEGLSSIGGVVGATYPAEAKRIRKIISKAFLLVPGYGAQGGKRETLSSFFRKDGLGALVVSSRDIIFSFRKKGMKPSKSWKKDVEEAAIKMKREVNLARFPGGRIS